ncbi:MAG: alpha/beta hydrolase [Hyphomicrobiaceae bacterium]
MVIASSPMPLQPQTSSISSDGGAFDGSGQDALAGIAAFERFCTPSLSSRRTSDHDELVARARFHLRGAQRVRLSTSVGAVETYTFAPAGPSKAGVLVLHGWSGEAAFMGAVGDFLRRRGYRAVLLDMPAHGLSEGRVTTLFDCARAALEVAEALGPIRFVFSHSIGAMAALAAGEGHAPLPRSYPFAAYVLIAMPDAFGDVTRNFGAEIGLTPGALRAFEARLEALAGRPIGDFTGGKLLSAVGRPALLLHARDDAEVPFACSEAMAQTTGAALQAFDRLGHRAILYAPQAVRAGTAFLDTQL